MVCIDCFEFSLWIDKLLRKWIFCVDSLFVTFSEPVCDKVCDKGHCMSGIVWLSSERYGGVMIVIVDSSEQETFFLLLKMSLAFWGKSACLHTHMCARKKTQSCRNAYTTTPLQLCDQCSCSSCGYGQWVLCSFVHQSACVCMCVSVWVDTTSRRLSLT